MLAAGLVLAACGSGAARVRGDETRPPAPAQKIAAVPARTVVHSFTGYRPDGTPTIASTRTAKGYCWNSSLAAVGRTAFRCFTDAGQILDPCFAPATPDPTSVSCVNDPWSHGTTLRLTRVLPEPVANEAARPWAIELATGVRCVASTGVVPDVSGVNLGYHCSDGTAAALQSVSTPLMTAVYADPDADPATATLRHTTVAGVWRT
jgi:hypothetical protein